MTANLTKFAGRHELRGGYTLFRSKLYPDGSRTLNDFDFMVIDGTTGSMRQARVALRFSY